MAFPRGLVPIAALLLASCGGRHSLHDGPDAGPDADGETCVDACTVAGVQRCAGEQVERCAPAAAGCLAWQGLERCADDGLFCADGACVECPAARACSVTGEVTSATQLAELVGCTRISGDLHLVGPEIESLASLRCLRRAERLSLSDTAITSLAGLERLEWTLALSFDRNDGLRAATDLDSLRVAAFGLSFSANESLESIRLTPPLEQCGTIEIVDNPALIEVSGFDGIADLTRLDIMNNDSLFSISGFNSIARLGPVEIKYNDTLDVINGFDDTTAEVVDIAVNPSLTAIIGFTGRGGARPWIHENESLRSICLGGEDAEIEDLALTRNPLLSSIECFAQRDIGSLTLGENESLTTLDGLHSLTAIFLLSLYGNDALVSLTGLSALRELDHLSLYSNNTLESLEGLGGVRELDTLTVSWTTSIASLHGLEAVEHVDELQITQNDALVTLAGLESLTVVDSSVYICDNPQLPACEAEAMLERLRTAGFAGEATVARNDGEGVCE